MPPRLSPARIACLLLLASAPAGAEDGAELEALRAADLRVATIGYRLAAANVALCDRVAPHRGFVLHSAAQYGAALRESAVAHFGLGATPSVMAVVPDGPAARAGMQADDRLLAVNGVALDASQAARGASFADVERAGAMIDRALASGSTVLRVERRGEQFSLKLPAVPVCASQFQLTLSPDVAAGADGTYVTVRSGLVNFVADDDELAVVMGHELAHNILGHRALLAAEGVGHGLSAKIGKDARRIRETEIEADRVGLYLAARAGFDTGVAPAFWARMQRKHGHGIFADATHPGGRERQRLIAATLAEIDARRARGEPLVPPRN